MENQIQTACKLNLVALKGYCAAAHAKYTVFIINELKCPKPLGSGLSPEKHRGSQNKVRGSLHYMFKTKQTNSFTISLCFVIAVVQVRMLLPVLAVLSHGPPVPAGHLTLVAGFAGRTHFNGGVLKRRGCYRHLVSTLHRSMTLNDFYTDTHNYSLSLIYLQKTGCQNVLFTEEISKPNVYL